jgi:hypothetical protein
MVDRQRPRQLFIKEWFDAKGLSDEKVADIY